MKNKSSILLLICLLIVSIITGCSSTTTSSQGEYPKKPVNVIVSYSAGGGTDVGARVLLPYVEEQLGVTFNVINKPGGGGWVGWTDLVNADPDGYTIGYINTPNLMTGYLDPQYKRDENLDSFDLIGNHVLDYGAIAINKDEKRFSTIVELMEYAKNNEVTAATTGVGSDDHIATLRLNKEFGTRFANVATSGAADGKASLLGAHVDVWFANVGEVTVPHNNGELITLAVLSEERSDFMPDVPTLEEAGYPGVYTWSARGLAAPKGMDPDILKKLVDAFEIAINNEEQVKKMEEMGLQVQHMKGDEYYQFLKEDEANVLSVSDLLGCRSVTSTYYLNLNTRRGKMKEKKIDQDTYIGIFLIIFSIIGILLSVNLPVGSDLFPKILFSILGLLAIPILVNSIKRSKDSKSEKIFYFNFEEIKLPLQSFLIIVVYVILIKFLGFFTATVIFVPMFMVFYRNKNIKHMIITIACMIGFVYLLFAKQLNVPFPTGIFF